MKDLTSRSELAVREPCFWRTTLQGIECGSFRNQGLGFCLLTPPVVLIAILLVTPRCEVFGLNFTVAGELRYEIQRPQGENEPLFRHYEIVVDDCNWKVSVELDRSTNRNIFVYQYDGANLVYYAQNPTTGAKVLSGMVEHSLVPQTWLSTAGEFVWLAFASHCYFEQVTNATVWSFEALRSRSGIVRRFEVPCEYSFAVEQPHLLNRVSYFTDKVLFLKDDGSLSAIPSPTFLSGEFRSSNFTNVSGFSFPTLFEYRAFRMKPDVKTTNDLSCILVVTGTATNLSVNSKSVTTVLPASRAYIQDLRVAQPRTFVRITNGVIPTTNHPIVESAQKRSARSAAIAELAAKAERPKRSIQRNLILLALAIAFVVPFVIYVLRRDRVA